jgi:hypothetical protein
MTYDGKFKVKISDVGIEINAEKVLNNIRKKHPNDKFEIEISSKSENYGTNKEENENAEITI